MAVTKKRRINPFYVILVLAGVAFAVTACGYGVMALQQMQANPYAPTAAADLNASPDGRSMQAFIGFFDQHGVSLMIGELVVLGLATFAAIGTDRFWTGDTEQGH